MKLKKTDARAKKCEYCGKWYHAMFPDETPICNVCLKEMQEIIKN